MFWCKCEITEPWSHQIQLKLVYVSPENTKKMCNSQENFTSVYVFISYVYLCGFLLLLFFFVAHKSLCFWMPASSPLLTTQANALTQMGLGSQ